MTSAKVFLGPPRSLAFFLTAERVRERERKDRMRAREASVNLCRVQLLPNSAVPLHSVPLDDDDDDDMERVESEEGL